MIRLHYPRGGLHDPIRGRLGQVHPPRLAIHEICVRGQLDVEPDHVAFPRDVHERALVRVDEGPVADVGEVRIGDDIDDAPYRV